MPRILEVTRTRTIQVFGAYTAETTTISDKMEVDVNHSDAGAASWRTNAIARLDQELDFWETRIRAKAASDEAARVKAKLDKEAAEQAAILEHEAKTNPPLPEQLGKLRELVGEMTTLTGEPVELQKPVTRNDAGRLIRELTASLEELRAYQARKASEAPAVGEAIQVVAQVAGSKLNAGVNVPAIQRVCSDARHGRNPRPITAKEWDFSVDRYGKPLCRDHQAEAPTTRRA